MKTILITILCCSFSGILVAQDITQFQAFGKFIYFVDAQSITKEEVQVKLHIYPEALDKWERAKRANTISYGFLGLQTVALIWSIHPSVNSLDLSAPNSVLVPFAVLVSTGTAAVLFQWKRRKLMREAILSHNQLNNSLGLNINENGLGLSLTF